MPFSTGATSISCAAIRSGDMSIEPSGAFLVALLLPDGVDSSFAGSGSVGVEVFFPSVGTAVQANMVRAAEDTCDTTPPSATPMARVATIVKIRFI
jgi:hypothetical protein